MNAINVVRSRWAALGAAVAVSLGTGGIGLVRAADGPSSSFVSITPCRLADTRASDNVGIRSTPVGPAETVTFRVRGTNGNCVIPDAATAIATNTTAVGPTQPSFLTVWPADAEQPLSSNLNYAPGSPPTPNQVTTGLSADGTIDVYNANGTVDVIIDIVGYYTALAQQPPQQPPTTYASTRNDAVALNANGGPNGATTINPMFLPAGTYLLTFTATLVNFSTTTDFFRCSLYSAGSLIAGNTVLLGPSVGSVATMTVQSVLTLTFAGTTAVGSTCRHDTGLPAGNTYYLDPGATLTAVPITPAGSA